jgi:hypothetical protein
VSELTIPERVAEPPFSPLVAQIITAQHQMARDTSSRLIDSLTAQLADAHARAAAVEAGVMSLIYGDYAPTTAAIERALFPSAELVARYRNDEGAVS